MAIDPNIAMSFQPAQIQSPLALAGQVATLKNAGLQQQLGQQALQQGQISLNQAGQNWQDEQADRAAISKNMQLNPQTGQTALNRAGYLSDLGQTAPRLALQRSQEFATQDFQRSQMQATIQKTQLENAHATLGALDNVLQGVHDEPSYQAALQTASSMPGLAQAVQGAPSSYDPTWVAAQHARVLTQQDQIKNQMEQATQTETARHNTATESTGQEQAQAAQTRADAAVSSARISGGRLGIEQQRLRMEQAYMPQAGGAAVPTGDAFLQTLNPAVQQQVKSIANGDVAMPSGSRGPAAQALRNAVLNYDPSYTDARYKGKQAFKTGNDANSIMQLSTAMEHADNAKQNSAKIGWAPVVGNKTLEGADSAAYTQDANFVTGELGKLVKGNELSDADFNRLSNQLMAARQSVRDAALSESLTLLGGKTGALFQKYKNATGQDLPVQEFFDQPTQQRLQKFGVVQGPAAPPAAPAGSVSVTAPDGSVHVFPNGDAAAKFKTLAGIK